MHLFRFERISEPVAPLHVFLRRLARNIIVALVLLGVPILIGVLIYRYAEGELWHQSLEDAVMVLSGQGPVRHAKEPWGRFFASLYALASGTVFILGIGIILAPIIHRVLHHLHVSDDP